MNSCDLLGTHFYEYEKILLKSLQPRDVITGDEQMNVVCAFVGDDRLEVHHVAHD